MQTGPGETMLPKSKRQRSLGSLSAASGRGGSVAADASAGVYGSAGAMHAPNKEAAVGWHVRVRVTAHTGRKRLVNAVVRDYDPPTGANPHPHPTHPRHKPLIGSLQDLLHCTLCR